MTGYVHKRVTIPCIHVHTYIHVPRHCSRRWRQGSTCNGVFCVVGFGWKRWHAASRKSCASAELSAIVRGVMDGAATEANRVAAIAIFSARGREPMLCNHTCACTVEHSTIIQREGGIVPSPTHVTRKFNVPPSQLHLLLPSQPPPFAPLTIITINITHQPSPSSLLSRPPLFPPRKNYP